MIEKELERNAADSVVHRLSSHALYLGTTSGELWIGRDGGERWAHIARHLPEIYAVEVATLA